MSPQLTSQGMVLATAAAMAVSGTAILLALRLLHKTLLDDSRFHPSPHPSPQVLLRPCISSSDDMRRSRGDNKSKKKKKKKEKMVRFADDVADPGIVFSKNNRGPCSCPKSSSTTNKSNDNKSGLATSSADKVIRAMPANRMALYNGILRDRVVRRMAYSY